MKKSVAGGLAGTSSGGAGTTSSRKSRVQIQTPGVPPPPQNPTENWRETDQRFHSEVAEDKKNFAAGKKRAQSHGDLRSAANAVTAGGVAVDLVALVVIESQSSPNLGGMIPFHAPFDATLLPEEKSPDYSKYIQCPHCGKKFEPIAASRHIPQCKEYYFNMEEKEKFQRSKSHSKSVSK